MMAFKDLKNRFWNFLFNSPNSYFSKKAKYGIDYLEYLEWNRRLQKVDLFKVSKIFTYTNANELKKLYELALECPKGAFALEIGSYLGASTCYIAAALDLIDGHLFCVDTWNNETMIEGEKDTFSRFQNNIVGVQSRIISVRKWSSELDSTDLQHPLSFVFIDGDHRYEAVRKDFELTQRWLSKDGIIAFHDFGNPDYEGVSRVVGEALSSGLWVLLGKVDTLVWIRRASWRQPSWLSKGE